jgi:uncharacterized membrane-anchored protein
MKSKIKIVLFIIFCILQTVLLIFVVINAGIIEKDAVVLKLRTNLYDPFDIMKGRYIHLNFEDSLEKIEINKADGLKTIPLENLKKMKHQTIYCIFEIDGEGYHVLKDAIFVKPDIKLFHTEKVFIAFRIADITDTFLYPRIHFENYYMQEGLAVKADSKLKDLNNLHPVLVLLVDKSGKCIQKDFLIENIRIEKYLEEK